MKSNTYIHRKVYTQNAIDQEKSLILKLYRKQLSLHNRGLGPKPDLKSLIRKSRFKNLVLEPQEMMTPEDSTYKGVEVARKLNIPKILPEFEKEEKSNPGFYILKYDTGIKIGISKNIKGRMINYNKPWCKPVLESWFMYIEYNVARDIELAIKRKFLVTYAVGSQEFFFNKSADEILTLIPKLAS